MDDLRSFSSLCVWEQGEDFYSIFYYEKYLFHWTLDKTDSPYNIWADFYVRTSGEEGSRAKAIPFKDDVDRRDCRWKRPARCIAAVLVAKLVVAGCSEHHCYGYVGADRWRRQQIRYWRHSADSRGFSALCWFFFTGLRSVRRLASV